MKATIATVRKQVSELIPSPYNENVRRITDEQMTALEASMEEFGFLELIVWNEQTGHIVAGHQRHKVLTARGVKETDVIPINVTAAREKTISLAMNKLGGDFVPEGVAALLQEIGEEERALTGFTEDDFETLLNQMNQQQEAATGRTDPDALPEPEDIETRTELGDLWILDGHRLLCGDATSPEAISFALDGEKPALMVTDPPYGVQVDHAWRDPLGKGGQRGGAIQGDHTADWSAVWTLVDAPVVYVWHASLHASEVQSGLEKNGFKVRQQIVWVKPRIIFGRSHYHWQHELCWFAVRNDHAPQEPTEEVDHQADDDEIRRWASRHDLHYHEEHQPCWYAVKKGSTAEWKGDRRQSTIWEERSPISVTGCDDDVATLHPTQKPIRVYEQPYRNHTRPGDLVFDAFTGSGTAIIAAERLGRRFSGTEIDTRFVDMAVTRWQQFTGKTAIRIRPNGDTEEFHAQESEQKEASPAETSDQEAEPEKAPSKKKGGKRKAAG